MTLIKKAHPGEYFISEYTKPYLNWLEDDGHIPAAGLDYYNAELCSWQSDLHISFKDQTGLLLFLMRYE